MGKTLQDTKSLQDTAKQHLGVLNERRTGSLRGEMLWIIGPAHDPISTRPNIVQT
jgi:hypothetical protein